MPGLPLPAQVSVAPFVTDPSEPTFTQIWDETMGNLGTPSDGFDSLLGQMIGLTDAIAPIADLDPTDLGALVDVQTELGIDDAGLFVSQMASARGAVDSALGIYSSVVTPGANPTPPVGGTPQPPASGGGGTAQPCTPASGAIDVGTLHLGDAAVRIEVATEDRFQRPVPSIVVTLEGGGQGIFSIQQVTNYQTTAGGAQYLSGWTWYLVINPAAVGIFCNTVRLVAQQPPGPPSVAEQTYKVTVQAKPTVGQPHPVA